MWNSIGQGFNRERIFKLHHVITTDCFDWLERSRAMFFFSYEGNTLNNIINMLDQIFLRTYLLVVFCVDHPLSINLAMFAKYCVNLR